MQHSKWNYIAVGISGVSTLVGAVLHAGFLTAVSLFLTIFNWYGAEFKRGVEKRDLVKATLKSVGMEPAIEEEEDNTEDGGGEN